MCVKDVRISGMAKKTKVVAALRFEHPREPCLYYTRSNPNLISPASHVPYKVSNYSQGESSNSSVGDMR